MKRIAAVLSAGSLTAGVLAGPAAAAKGGPAFPQPGPAPSSPVTCTVLGTSTNPDGSTLITKQCTDRQGNVFIETEIDTD